ncbi:hypothetical protein [Dyadobacter bucti]|uniref:hypothetical protein n=1 Tax=Dyadobacter bucti TaxID=2572203 RepID=UPI003F6FDF7B
MGKDKSVQYALAGAVFGGVIGSVTNKTLQAQRTKDFPEKIFDDAEYQKAVVNGALAGAMIGFLIGKSYNAPVLPPRKSKIDSYLSKHADSLRLNKGDLTFRKLDWHADVLKGKLYDRFQQQLQAMPYRQGSTERGAALGAEYDIDLVLPFKENSFGSISEMYQKVFEFLTEQTHSNSEFYVRKQKKSIGVTYKVGRQYLRVDVVPYKISNFLRDKYTGYLHINDERIFLYTKSYTKTNPKKTIGRKLGANQQKVLLLLKNWKKYSGIPLSSHLLEYLLRNAYLKNKGALPGGISGKVAMVLQYTINNLENRVIRGNENSNNVLTNIPDSDKSLIMEACENLLAEYQNDLISFKKNLIWK